MRKNRFSNCLNTGNTTKAYNKDGKQRIKITKSFDCELGVVVFEGEELDDLDDDEEIELDDETLIYLSGIDIDDGNIQ